MRIREFNTCMSLALLCFQKVTLRHVSLLRCTACDSNELSQQFLPLRNGSNYRLSRIRKFALNRTVLYMYTVVIVISCFILQ